MVSMRLLAGSTLWFVFLFLCEKSLRCIRRAEDRTVFLPSPAAMILKTRSTFIKQLGFKN